MRNSKWRALIVSLLSVVIGLIFGAIVMLVFQYNPLVGYKALLEGAIGNPFNIGQTIRAATPLILTGLGFSVAYTAGFFNIGLSGQALFGWVASVWVALAMPDQPKIIVLPLAIIAGALAGAVFAAIPGFLKAFFNTSEVIVTIMLNYVSVYTVDYIVRNILTNQADATQMIGENASLAIPYLTQITNFSKIHGGIFIALAMVVLVYIFINKTALGFEFKAVGMNKYAANYAGMNAKKNIILAMVISGGLAGLGGVMNGLGEFGNIFLTNGVAPQIGFDGMAVALLGGLNPIGLVFASFLFGGLQTGASFMSFSAKVPQEIVGIVTASIIFFVGANYVIRYFMDRRSKATIEKEG